MAWAASELRPRRQQLDPAGRAELGSPERDCPSPVGRFPGNGRRVIGAARRRRLRTFLTLVCVTVALVAWGSPPARAAACPEGSPTPTSNCGPELTLPRWGDAAGWTEPSKFSTIQLGDVNGDGKDELLGRGDSRHRDLDVRHELGQWRPQVTAQDVPVVPGGLPLPAALRGHLGWNWNRPYYSTIQTANPRGDAAPGDIARFPTGCAAYEYKPPAGRQGHRRRSVAPDSPGEQFSDAAEWSDPSLYLSIHTVSAVRPPQRRAARIPDSFMGPVDIWASAVGGLDRRRPTRARCSDHPADYLSTRRARYSWSTAP